MKLVSKYKFSQLCGVTPASINKACKHGLAPAIVGKRIDTTHTSAIEYRARQESAKDINAPDPQLEEVAVWCATHNRYSVTGIVESGIVGRVRAKRILAELVGTTPAGDAETVARESERLGSEKSKGGEEPDVASTVPSSSPDPAPDIKPHTRGWNSHNENKKYGKTPDGTIDIPDNIVEFADWTLRDIIKRFGSDAMFLDFLKALKEIENINEKRLKNAQTEGTLVARALVQVGVIDVVDSAMRKLLTAGTKKIARMAHSMTLAGETVETIEIEVKDQVGQYVKNIKVKSARALRE